MTIFRRWVRFRRAGKRVKRNVVLRYVGDLVWSIGDGNFLYGFNQSSTGQKLKYIQDDYLFRQVASGDMSKEQLEAVIRFRDMTSSLGPKPTNDFETDFSIDESEDLKTEDATSIPIEGNTNFET